MSDEIWVKRRTGIVVFHATKESAEKDCDGPYLWYLDWLNILHGPEMECWDVIAIRPLRIERVEVQNG